MKITSGYEQITVAIRKKNWYLLAGLAQCVNTWGPETITIKYLGKSHKFMVTNAIHGNIGKLFRKTSTVATFDDFVQLCEKANNNIKTTVLDLRFTYPIFKKSAHKIIDQSKNASYGNYS